MTRNFLCADVDLHVNTLKDFFFNGALNFMCHPKSCNSALEPLQPGVGAPSMITPSNVLKPYDITRSYISQPKLSALDFLSLIMHSVSILTEV